MLRIRIRRLTWCVLSEDAVKRWVILIPFAFLRLNNKAKAWAGIKILNIVINVALNLILILYFKLGIEAIFISF